MKDWVYVPTFSYLVPHLSSVDFISGAMGQGFCHVSSLQNVSPHFIYKSGICHSEVSNVDFILYIIKKYSISESY